ncbi:MAG: hypothetical protein QM811_30410 [Pirellulales bacterium]
MPRPNPYETTPRLVDLLSELIRERFRCEAKKNLILEFGRTAVVLGAAMLFAAGMALLEPVGWRGAINRGLIGGAFVVVGLSISYVFYRPLRKRLNEIEAQLPQAQAVGDEDDPRPDTIDDDLDESDSDVEAPDDQRSDFYGE